MVVQDSLIPSCSHTNKQKKINKLYLVQINLIEDILQGCAEIGNLSLSV